MPDGISRHYEFDKFISSLRVVGYIYLQFHSNFKSTFYKQTVQSLISSDLVLHYLLMSHKMDAGLIWVSDVKFPNRISRVFNLFQPDLPYIIK